MARCKTLILVARKNSTKVSVLMFAEIKKLPETTVNLKKRAVYCTEILPGNKWRLWLTVENTVTAALFSFIFLQLEFTVTPRSDACRIKLSRE